MYISSQSCVDDDHSENYITIQLDEMHCKVICIFSYMNLSIAKFVMELFFIIIIVLRTQGMNMYKEGNLHNDTNLKSISKYI